MQFDYTISHVPGKLLHTADTLSRSPQQFSNADQQLAELIERQMTSTTLQLPTIKDSLDKYRRAQSEDPICSKLITFCQTTWPEKHTISGELSKYWTARHELTVCDSLLLYRMRIVVPAKLQHDTLCKLHRGHQGIERCRFRVTTSVWWPGVSSQMEQLIKQCPTCVKVTPPAREPMLSSALPKYPWRKVATDLFELNKQSYLLVVDYYSRYPEVIKLNTTTSASIVSAMKTIFSRHGIPQTVISDNGPQYDSSEMKQFSSTYGFKHVTSSPYYPRGNGLAERMVKTVKSLLKQTSDMALTLLSYRATPLPWCLLSPAELLMGRRLRTDVPQVANQLVPNWPHLQGFAEKDKQYKEQQKEQYDRRHRVRSATQLPADTDVWVNSQGKQVPGTIITNATTPRSYIVDTPSGENRRNRSHITERLNDETITIPTHQTSDPGKRITRSQTGTQIRPPDRLTYS